jgi:guanosine-3',5'-bis(diphosphate) 3'-pyrophosphohydrolase
MGKGDPMTLTFTEQDLALIFKALTFAAEKHRRQRRKDHEETPYINHPIGIAEVLWRVGGVRDVPTLIAAILHDTIEDTGARPEEIAVLFGEEVLALVQEVSDDKSLPKAVRKQLQIEHAPHISRPAKLIKLADKIHNVYSIGHSPPKDWPAKRLADYLDWAENVVDGLRGASADLERHFDETLAQARAHLCSHNG